MATAISTAVWTQRLAVAVDGPLEEHAPGAARLRALSAAYLDARRATRGRPPAGRLFVELLAEDLAVLGAVSAGRAAHDLLGELDEVVALEDRAGKVLPRERQALLVATGLAGRPQPRRAWLSCLRPVGVA